MEIRKATTDDMERLNELTLQMHEFLGKQMGVTFAPGELDHENIKENELGGVYIAVESGRIVGYIAFSTKTENNEFYGDYYDIHHLIVDEKFRGKGIGEKLLKIIMEKAKKEGVNVLTEVLVTNEGALKFYKKTGFKIVEQTLVIDNQKRMKKL